MKVTYTPTAYGHRAIIDPGHPLGWSKVTLQAPTLASVRAAVAAHLADMRDAEPGERYCDRCDHPCKGRLCDECGE
jgi:hypothetical protein